MKKPGTPHNKTFGRVISFYNIAHLLLAKVETIRTIWLELFVLKLMTSKMEFHDGSVRFLIIHRSFLCCQVQRTIASSQQCVSFNWRADILRQACWHVSDLVKVMMNSPETLTVCPWCSSIHNSSVQSSNKISYAHIHKNLGLYVHTIYAWRLTNRTLLTHSSGTISVELRLSVSSVPCQSELSTKL